MKLKHILFPKRCRCCGDAILPWDNYCKVCIDENTYITGETCTHCGTKKEDCICKKAYLPYDRITAAYYYEGGVRRGVYLLKFYKNIRSAEAMAEDMYLSYGREGINFDYDFISFVPQTKDEQTNRGFNQAQLLANLLSVYCSIPTYNALEKLYSSKPQRSLRASFRKGNVFGIFDTRKGVEIQNKRILLVDDVRTTGATLDECAKMLKIHGADTVDVIVYACTKSIETRKKPIDKN